MCSWNYSRFESRDLELMGAFGEKEAEKLRYVLHVAGAVPVMTVLITLNNTDPKQHTCFSCNYAVWTIPSS